MNLQQVLAVMWKEVRQMARDRMTVAMMIGITITATSTSP